MKYKYPNPVLIVGNPYTVTFVNASSVDEESSTGCSRHDLLEIRISTKTVEGKERHILWIEKTLWHELIHSIAKVFSLDIGESAVEGLSQGVSQILTDAGFHLVTEETE